MNEGGSSGGNNMNPYANIFGGIASMFSQNPGNAASQYFNQIPGMLNGVYSPWMGQNAQQAMNPYLQSGQWANSNLQGQIGNLINNPGQFMNQMGQGFQQSPGFQFQVGQATNAANSAAAAGGMAGSPAEQQSLAGTVNGLANQDYYNWLNGAMGLYGKGLEGLQGMYGTGAGMAQNQYDTGASMANAYGENLASSMENQGINAYNGQMNQNQSFVGGLGEIGQGIGALGGVGGLISSIGSWL